MQSHQQNNDEHIAQYRRQIATNPEDTEAVRRLVSALRAKGEYGEAVQWLERLDILRREDKELNRLVPGHPGSALSRACLHWMMGHWSEGISLMHGSVAGILDGSTQYGDAAGGMMQGLLLHYMGVTAKHPLETSYALDYLKNRIKRLRTRLGDHLTVSWPCSVAQYLVGEVEFDAVMEDINREGPFLNVPDAAARLERRRRIQLAEAVFHDGVRRRAAGDEERCLARMRESCELVDPPISQEGYLARYEVERAAHGLKDSPV